MMETMRQWFAKFLSDHLQHSVLAALMMLIVGTVLSLAQLVELSAPVLGGALAGIAFFYGREERDAENKNPELMDHYKAFAFWKWGEDERLDFCYPLISNIVLFVLVTLLRFVT